MSDQPTPSPVPEPGRPRISKRPVVMVVLLVLLVLLPTGLIVTNALVMPPEDTPLTTELVALHPEFEPAAHLLEEKCLDCHAAAGTKPFYASLPIVSSVVSKDIETGRTYIDLVADLQPIEPGGPLPEAALAKLEYVLQRDTMPPTEYAMLHWDRVLDDQQRDLMLEVIAEHRAKHYPKPAVMPEFVNKPYRPLPQEVTDVEPAKVALGEALFHDVRLSADNSLSCASCHGLDTGGVDRRPTSIGVDGQVGPINSPTVFNARYNAKQFWDGRSSDLVDQAAGPVHNPIEMGSDWEEVLAKLRQDEELVAAFEAAYPDGLTGDNIAHAIAEFEKTLITPNAPFDRYLRGDEDALTAAEQRGLQLFEENACASCHVGEALGGRSFEVIGRAQPYFTDPAAVEDVDQGRYNVTADPFDRFAFKVPVLRNVALTAPYFHDASQETLADAVRAMALHQGYRAFTAKEIADVVAFLKTLTGEYQGVPLDELGDPQAAASAETSAASS